VRNVAVLIQIGGKPATYLAARSLREVLKKKTMAYLRGLSTSS
jgi:hypothetical protein